MNYVINEDICKKKGMDLPSLLAVLLVRTGVNITELFNDLVNKEVLVKDMFSEGFLVTQRWDSTCSDILLSADTSVPSDERLLPLVDTLMSIFPSGKKEGTSLYWKGNRKDNKERSQSSSSCMVISTLMSRLYMQPRNMWNPSMDSTLI